MDSIKSESLILLVEDDADTRALAEMLLTDAGYPVLAAANAAEARALIEQHAEIALVFTDLQMPGRYDGWDLIEGLRSAGNTLPAILSSGAGLPERTLPAHTLFLGKPYSLRQLYSMVESSLANAALACDEPRSALSPLVA